ncbi:MAG TPA: fibronectin type III domain-containing protein, partial [Armatimonadota bacterium]
MEISEIHYLGSPTAVTETTLTFPGVNWTTNCWVTDDLAGWNTQYDASVIYISRGPGRGQWRRILANSANSLTIDRPWDAPPDAGSVLSIEEAAARWAVYHNTVDGLPDDNGDGTPDYLTRICAVIGVDFFGEVFDGIIANNTVSHMVKGIDLVGRAGSMGSPSQVSDTEANILVTGNTVSQCKYGLALETSAAPSGAGDPVVGPSTLGCVFRDNQVSEVVTGFSSDRNSISYLWDWPWSTSTLVEANTLSSCTSLGAYLGKQQDAMLLRNNSFTGSAGSTAGISFDPAPLTVMNAKLYNNGYATFPSWYSGTLPGSGQQLDGRSLRFHALTGGSYPPAQTATLWNVGTSSLTSLVSSDSSWLTGSLNWATIDDEQAGSAATLTVSANTTGLPAGDYYGTLTLTGDVQYSPLTLGVTLVLDAPVGTLSAPGGVSALGTSSSVIRISWTAVTGATSYKVERSTDGLTAWTQIATPGAAATYYDDTGLSTGATYCYRLRTTNASGDSSTSDVVIATTLPSAPALTATAASDTAITLSWTDVTGETGYYIERSPNGTASWTQVGSTLPANTTACTDSGLSVNTTYYYRMHALNASGNSADSNTANATTYALPTPTNLTATTVSTTQIDLAWTDVSGEAGYYVERSPNGVDTWSQIGSTAANTTTYQNTSLSAGATYYYRVRAYTGATYSAYSNIATQVTIPKTGLQLWLRADWGVSKDGNNRVSVWSDQSGTGNHAATLASPCYQPSYTANAVNGKPVIRFDGVYNYLNGNLAMTNNQRTIFCVYASVTCTANGAIFSLCDGVHGDSQTNGEMLLQYPSGANSGLKWFLDSALVRDTYGWANGTFNVMTASTNATQAKLFKNGVQQGTTATITDQSRTTATYALSARQVPYVKFCASNDIAEVLVFNTALSDVD